MLQHVPGALAGSFSLDVLVALIIGGILGTIIGALPGLGTVLGLVIFLPVTFGMDTTPAIAMLLAVYVTSIYGGSISAILINVPGTPQSAATVLEGYPMAQRGDSALALGWATIASAAGGLFSLVVLIIAAPLLARVALEFGPIETFALIVFALTTISWVSRESLVKGLLAAAIGLFLATVGPDDMTGQIRFDFGVLFLSGGFGVIPLLIGLFAISEVLYQAASLKNADTPAVRGGGFKVAPWSEWRPRIQTLLRSCGIGSFIGVLPGTGATAAVFVSYADAMRRSPRSKNFGKGEPDGLVASEAANNAVSGGALVPTLALGIPGDGGTAVLLGALTIHGVIPGVRLFTEKPDVVTGIFVLLLYANIMMLVVGALGSGLFAKMLRTPVSLLMPLVVMMSVVGAFAVRVNPLDVVIAVIAGFVGFFLRLGKVPIPPIIIAFVLGTPFEMSLRQGLVITDQNFWLFFQRPIADFLFAVTAIMVAWPWIKKLLPQKAA